MTFHDFNLEPSLMEGLDAMGFKKPTPIQEQAIPIILNNKDLIACAQTGTGKTAAFLLPTINDIIKEHSHTLNTLIIVPTRELAVQIDEALQGFSYYTPVSSIAIYGGTGGEAFNQEKRALTQGSNIIIATPGRFIAHLNMGYVKFDNLRHLILDEADRMLDMGFSDDINKIITYLPANRQTLLFSATMPPQIRALAKKILTEPVEINIALSKPAAGVMQGAYVVYSPQKIELLKSLLHGKKITSILVFASTKEKVKDLGRELKRDGFNAAMISSDLEQAERNETLRRFKSRQLQILVATDVLSRGIDIDSIGLVINYDVPGDAEDYIHRVGRTARAEQTGIALTFISPDDQQKFKRIEDLIGNEVKKLALPKNLGEGPEYNPSAHRERAGRNGRGGRDGRKPQKRGFRERRR